MVVNVLVYIKCWKDIKGVIWWYQANGVNTIDGKEVCCMENAINMKHGNTWWTVIFHLQLNHPHSCIFVTFLKNMRKPAHKHTWICLAIEDKWEEQQNANNPKPMEAVKFRLWVNKDTVVTSRTLSPGWSCSNMFPTHGTDATWITWSIVASSSQSQQSGRPFKVDFRFVSCYVMLCDPRNGRKVA